MDAVIRSGRITRWNPRRRQVRRRTYASAHACDEGKVYRGPPPQLPLRCGCPPKHLAPLELPPPWAPLPFVREYPRIVAAECVDKRRTRAGRRKEFSLGEDRNPIEPRPLASLVVPFTRWIMRGLCMEWYNGREREREKSTVVERDFTFGSRKLSEGSRDRNPLITRNRFYRLPRVNTRRRGGERVGRGREEKRGERERGRRPSSVRGGGPERSLIIRWEWRERSSLFLR